MTDSLDHSNQPGFWYDTTWVQNSNPLTTTGNRTADYKDLIKTRKIVPADMDGNGRPDTLLMLLPGRKPTEGLDAFVPIARGREVEAYFSQHADVLESALGNLEFKSFSEIEYIAWTQPKISAGPDDEEPLIVAFVTGAVESAIPSFLIAGVIALAAPELATFVVVVGGAMLVTEGINLGKEAMSGEANSNEIVHFAGGVLGGFAGGVTGFRGGRGFMTRTNRSGFRLISGESAPSTDPILTGFGPGSPPISIVSHPRYQLAWSEPLAIARLGMENPGSVGPQGVSSIVYSNQMAIKLTPDIFSLPQTQPALSVTSRSNSWNFPILFSNFDAFERTLHPANDFTEEEWTQFSPIDWELENLLAQRRLYKEYGLPISSINQQIQERQIINPFLLNGPLGIKATSKDGTKDSNGAMNPDVDNVIDLNKRQKLRAQNRNIIQGNGFRIDVLTQISDPSNDNVDVSVIMDNGEVYCGTLFTPDNLRDLLESSENAFFYLPQMVIIPSLTEDTIRNAVEGLIQKGQIESAFTLQKSF